LREVTVSGALAALGFVVVLFWVQSWVKRTVLSGVVLDAVMVFSCVSFTVVETPISDTHLNVSQSRGSIYTLNSILWLPWGNKCPPITFSRMLQSNHMQPLSKCSHPAHEASWNIYFQCNLNVT
jgi:hypothetical protein